MACLGGALRASRLPQSMDSRCCTCYCLASRRGGCPFAQRCEMLFAWAECGSPPRTCPPRGRSGRKASGTARRRPVPIAPGPERCVDRAPGSAFRLKKLARAAPPGPIARPATRFARIELPRRRRAAQLATELWASNQPWPPSRARRAWARRASSRRASAAAARN